MSYTVAQPGALPIEEHSSHVDSHVHHGFFRTYVWSHDHKMIGKQYLFASMFFGAISGILAMGVRCSLDFQVSRFLLRPIFCRAIL